MITESQLSSVRNYLLSKKLPIDILIEVEDHFVTHITESLRNDSDFENAFLEVKNLWSKELSFPKYNIQFDLNDITYFVKEINKNLFKSTLKVSFYCSVFLIFLMLFLAFLVDVKIFSYISLSILVIIYLVPPVFYVKNIKDFRLTKKYDNYVLTYHQNYILQTFVASGVIFQLFIRFENICSDIFLLLHGSFSWSGVFSLLGSFMLILWCVFTFLSQKKYLHQIEKVKPFLKYLKTT